MSVNIDLMIKDHLHTNYNLNIISNTEFVFHKCCHTIRASRATIDHIFIQIENMVVKFIGIDSALILRDMTDHSTLQVYISFPTSEKKYIIAQIS